MSPAFRPVNLDLDTLQALLGELDAELPRFNFLGGEERQRSIDEWVGVSWARHWIALRIDRARRDLGIERELEPGEAHARAAREHLERTRAPRQSTVARGAVPAREDQP